MHPALFSHCAFALGSPKLVNFLIVKYTLLNTPHENKKIGQVTLMKKKEVFPYVLLVCTPFWWSTWYSRNTPNLPSQSCQQALCPQASARQPFLVKIMSCASSPPSSSDCRNTTYTCHQWCTTQQSRGIIWEPTNIYNFFFF